MFGKRRTKRQEAVGREALHAGGAYLVARIVNDQSFIDDVVSHTDTFVLQAALVEIAQRAVSALARERGVGVEETIASLMSQQPTDSGSSGRS